MFEKEIANFNVSKSIDFLNFLMRGGNHNYFCSFRANKTLISNWWSTPSIENYPLGKVNQYFGVNPSNVYEGKNKRSSLSNISVVNTLFADFDSKDYQNDMQLIFDQLRNFPEPSVIIFSGHGLHCYWLLSEPIYLNSEDVRKYWDQNLKKWVRFVGGDKAASSLANILRVPGTINKKLDRDEVFVDFLKCDLQERYDPSYLLSLIPKEEQIEHSELVDRPHKLSNVKTSEYHLSLPIRLLFRDNLEDIMHIIRKIQLTKNGEPITLVLSTGEIKTFVSRSEAEASVVTRLILFGWDFEQIREFFIKEKPGHFIKKNGLNSDEYLIETYSNVIAHLLESTVRKQIIKKYIHARILATRMEITTKEFLVLESIIAKAFAFGCYPIRVSVREIIEYTGFKSIATVNRHVTKLVNKGILAKWNEEDSDRRTVYDLSQISDEGGGKEDQYPPAPPPNTTDLKFPPHLETTTTAEVWNFKHYGPVGKHIYQYLNDEPKSINQLVKLTKHDKKTVRKKILNLGQIGLAEYTELGWIVGKVNPRELSRQEDFVDEHKSMMTKHKLDRDGYRSWKYMDRNKQGINNQAQV